MEMLLDKVNQNIPETLKKFQDNKNNEYEKKQKQISELIGALINTKVKQRTLNREMN
jgi:hypothetical protein